MCSVPRTSSLCCLCPGTISWLSLLIVLLLVLLCVLRSYSVIVWISTLPPPSFGSCFPGELRLPVFCRFFSTFLHSVPWLCWLGSRKGIRPVKNWVVGCWHGYLVWSEVQTCIWPSWCHCHSQSLASVKSRLVLPFWYQLTRVVPVKGPLNGCVCVFCLFFSTFTRTSRYGDSVDNTV